MTTLVTRHSRYSIHNVGTSPAGVSKFVVVLDVEGARPIGNCMPNDESFGSLDEAIVACEALDLAIDICRGKPEDHNATFWRLMALARNKPTVRQPPEPVRRSLAQELHLLLSMIGTDSPQGHQDMRDIVIAAKQTTSVMLAALWVANDALVGSQAWTKVRHALDLAEGTVP